MSLPVGRSTPRLRAVAGRRVRIRGSGHAPLLTVASAAGLSLALAAVGLIAGSAGRASRTDDGAGVGSVARSTTATTRTQLPDAPWLAQRGDERWLFGRGDRPPIRALPAGELGLAIDDRFVASMVPTAQGRSLIRFRDTTRGSRVTEIAAPIWVAAGAFTRSGLVVTGYGDATMTTDGGLLAIAPDSGAVTTLVPAGSFAAGLGSPVARGDVLVSPSGNMVASNACGLERCALQVVDLTTGRVSRPIDGGLGFVRAVTDELVVSTDDAGRWIRGAAIADGHRLWQRDGASLIEPAALDDGSVVGLVGSAKSGWAIATIDRAGQKHDLTPRDRGSAAPPHLWRSLMTPRAVVFGSIGFEEALGAKRATDVTVITPRDGRSSKTSIQLPAVTETVP